MPSIVPGFITSMMYDLEPVLREIAAFSEG